jgi:hypothetical protein
MGDDDVCILMMMMMMMMFGLILSFLNLTKTDVCGRKITVVYKVDHHSVGKNENSSPPAFFFFFCATVDMYFCHWLIIDLSWESQFGKLVPFVCAIFLSLQQRD